MGHNNLPGLILIDIQKGLDEWAFYGDSRNNPYAEANARQLLLHWRRHQGFIFHIKHNSTNPQSPLHPDNPGNQIKELVEPLQDEIVFTKNVNSAFIGTPLLQELETKKIQKIVIAGLTAEHCISTSVRMAANLGFEVILARDGTAAFSKTKEDGQIISADIVCDVTLANLQSEFCELLNTDEIILKFSNNNG